MGHTWRSSKRNSMHRLTCVLRALHQPGCSAENGTGIFASAQFALVFSPLKPVVSDAALLLLQGEAQELLHSPGLSAFTKAQYEIQNGWLTTADVGHVEYIMFAGGGATAVSPTPGAAYLTMYMGNMVGLDFIFVVGRI